MQACINWRYKFGGGGAENMTDDDGWKAITWQFKLWELNDEQAADLLGISLGDWSSIQSGDHEGIHTAEVGQRADALLRIHAALRVILMEPRCNGWVHRPNDAEMFGGETALNFMIAGGQPAIMRVARYIEAELYG